MSATEVNAPVPAVSVQSVSKRFKMLNDRQQTLKQAVLNRKRTEHDEFWALRDVSFDVHAGETFGIIGHNGSGKSTMLKCLTGILTPNEGSVTVNGSISALLELGAGFHPELSGRENVFLNAAILGVTRQQVEERFDDIVEFAGLERFIDTPVKNYSSGMYVRLGFAVAINVDPDVLIVDEVLAVGDADFQARCGDRIRDFRERGKTIVLVTHSMTDVNRLCSRVAWLDRGRLRQIGTPNEVADTYLSAALSDRSVQVFDGQRWGSQEVQIEGVTIADAHREPIDVAVTHAPMSVVVSLTADEPVEGCEVVVSIYTQEGVMVTEACTTTAQLELPPLGAHHTVVMAVDKLPLNPGTYDVTVAVRDIASQRDYDVRSKFLRFEVVAAGGSDGGVITLDTAWHDFDSSPHPG